MTKQYYECHITLFGVPEILKSIVEDQNWTFSAIDGDPDLGPGVKCYATKQMNIRLGEPFVILALNDTANALAHEGCKVLRRKVELVIHDDRSKE